MKKMRFVVVLTMAFAAHTTATAQNATILSDGKAFAGSLAPQSAGQIVNPSGVNPAAWSAGASAIPTSMPSGLGAFSSPLTSSPLYGVLGAQGALSGLGNSKILSCKNYIPTGNPIADQECAAVKFMNKDCVPLNNSQLQVVGATSVATTAGVNCTDTYGSGLSNFGYQNAITANDAAFQLTQSAQNNASAVAPQSCVSMPNITRPALYETSLCNKTARTDPHVCSQDLAVAITTSYFPATPNYSCTVGVLQGKYCIQTVTIPASVSYWCPVGTLSGANCVSSSVTPAVPVYQCPPGTTLNGAVCESKTTSNATLSYSCPGGRTPLGNQCKNALVQTHWVDNCLTYEQSAGVPLGAPK